MMDHLPFKPTIRITMKCTQSCSHCAFACSPNENMMMTLEHAEQINEFLQVNDITRINVMGGEFWLNPNWEAIINALGRGMKIVRIVTNGDWHGNKRARRRVKKFFKSVTLPAYIAISKDEFHHNRHVERAKKFCIGNGIDVVIDCETSSEGIVPIKRGRMHRGFYPSIAKRCTRERREEGFMIDEEGNIYRCSLGIWDLDHVSNYLHGGFNERWEEIIKSFRRAFIMSCNQCVRMHAEFVSQKTF